MKYLITGGAGFIGSHLSERLLQDNHEVTVIDNLSTGSIQNISHLQKNDHFRLVVDSIIENPTLEKLIQDTDFVFHLAASVGVKLIITNPIQTIQTNIEGTETLLRFCNKWRKPLIFTSTSEVYGKNPSPTFSEDDDMIFGPTTHSRWSYACSKAIDEFLILAHVRKNKLEATIARLFNTVGPKQTSQYGMVIPTFVSQALKNKPITVYGDGQQTRTFCYVTDAVNALLQLSKQKETMGQVYNIGGNQEISILELAKLIKDRAQSTSEITMVPYDQAYEPGFEDMKKRVPNISKLHNAIGYTPEVSLNSIVDNVIKYFQDHSDFI